jgi:drug/metabolite transporter (DMT)-like permease
MSPETALAVFPLMAAVFFALSTVVLKRANQLGAGVWQTAFVVNLFNGVCYSLLWFVESPPMDWQLLWQPGLIAVCLFGGMAMQFIALDRGDISVAVPILGLKVLIVAALTPLLTGEALRASLWLSAFLSVLGVTFLNRTGSIKPQKSLAPAIIAGGLSAFFFASFDILVELWGRSWGAGRLLPCIFWMTALLSAGCTLRYPVHLAKLTPLTWKWLLSGAFLISLQSVLFVGCLAVYGQAARANIFYSIRGLLSVVLVWTIGHWFASEERQLSTLTFVYRLLGAGFILAAIIITMLDRS